VGPGNVRQLLREVERLVALTPAGTPLSQVQCSSDIAQRDVVAPVQPVAADDNLDLPGGVKALEIRLIRAALDRRDGNKLKAAQDLGITRQGLHKKLKRYNLEANA
jgi:DNA-binding NtrC family response regulator